MKALFSRDTAPGDVSATRSGEESADLRPLFAPLALGRLMLPNRVVMTAVKLGYSTTKGEVTERHIAFYVRRTRGGVGLITSEPMWVQVNGRELPTQLGIHEDSLTGGLKRLADAVHAAGGRIMAHINHAGRAANPMLVPAGQLVSASDVICPANGVTPRALHRGEIAEIVSAFGHAGRRALEAGFDALEVPFSHGYLVHQFLSPHTNRRTDEYGGTLQDRLRFGREVIAAVRSAVGPGFPIIVRMNATDYVEGGLTISDAIEIALALEAMGVQGLSITSGTMCESVPFCLYPTGTPKANLLPMASRIRGSIKLPVIVAGRIRTPAVAQEALVTGQTDLIGLGRPLLADPDWVRKTRAGDEGAILLCAACHQGCLAELRKGHGTGCAFNPLTGREADGELTPAAQPKRVMVAGGGPAGLEAAFVAAQRGHRVTLYEQNDHLGGQFHLAAKPPYKEGFLDVIRYLELMARRAGVQIRLRTKVTAQTVLREKPDAVILAVGGIPLTVPFPGLEESRWFLASDLLEEAVEVETLSALVIGAGLVGLETADFLTARGKKVTLVEMLPDVGMDMDPLAKAMVLKRLSQHGVTMHVNTKVTRLTKDTAFARRGDEEIELPIETVVLAVGVRPNRELTDALADTDLAIHVIGDALEPRKAIDAIQEGFEVALKL